MKKYLIAASVCIIMLVVAQSCEKSEDEYTETVANDVDPEKPKRPGGGN